MVKEAIKIFARLKPTESKHKYKDYTIEHDENDFAVLIFNTPKELSDGFINNKKEKFKFRFQKVFDSTSTQDEIFQNVAQPVIENVLQGYNGTIFAYGQTGSGKTYTMTGGGRHINDRGIIMRTIEHIYRYYQKNQNMSFKTRISYLEIYNDNGYDLLDPKQKDNIRLDELPKVSLMEDSHQNIHLRNLSIHETFNEDEARNLLFIGDINRVVAETPMNISSTRSHCIFTLHIASKQNDSPLIRNSKLHLVDLAGSERVSKTGVNGLLLNEAKHINLSLHHLEQVIIALSEKGRSHIPYRNSLMTSVLRDSLGGNCMTSMISTCSLEIDNIDESISTCRFSQRVALINNQAELNEELDGSALIEKLKSDVERLKGELSLATGVINSEELSDIEKNQCANMVNEFLSNPNDKADINIDLDMRKIFLCFRLLKERLKAGEFIGKQLTTFSENFNQSTELNEYSLTNSYYVTQQNDNLTQHSSDMSKSNSNNEERFKEFSRKHHLYETLSANKKHLKKLTQEAKVLGMEIKNRKDGIEQIKLDIEKFRIQQTFNGFDEADDRENNFIAKLEGESFRYHKLLQQLKNLKLDVDQTKHIIKKNNMLIHRDYEIVLQTPTDSSVAKKSFDSLQNSISSNEYPRTGDVSVDEDIKAFLEARNRIKNK